MRMRMRMSKLDILLSCMLTWMSLLFRLICMSFVESHCMYYVSLYPRHMWEFPSNAGPYNFVPLVERYNVYHLSHMHIRTPIFITKSVHQKYYVNDTYYIFFYIMVFFILSCEEEMLLVLNYTSDEIIIRYMYIMPTVSIVWYNIKIQIYYNIEKEKMKKKKPFCPKRENLQLDKMCRHPVELCKWRG